MAAPMRKFFCRGAQVSVNAYSCKSPLPACHVLGQQVRFKSQKTTRFRAPHEAKEAVKWTKQKSTKVTTKNILKPLTKKVVDDVWIRRYYAKPTYSVVKAIEMHKEFAQPDISDNMDGKVVAKFVLDFTMKKKTKFVRPFQEIIHIPHPFEHGEKRNIIAFCKEPEEIKEAERLGAVYAGGVDLINKIDHGDIPVEEFDYVISTYDVAPDLVKIRSMIKDLFPSKQKGNLTTDISEAMDRFKNGHRYVSRKSDTEAEGILEVEFGHLRMTSEELEENLVAFIKAICHHRSPDLGPFIKNALVLCPPSLERFQVDVCPYLPKSKKQLTEEKEAEESDGETEARASS